MSKNYKQNNIKNILHGFFLSIAMTIAEPSTILPLIIHHFTESVVLIGFFAFLLRGGAVIVQMVAAFYAQSFKQTLPYLKIVFAIRVISWFLIGVSILVVGDSNPTLTLTLFAFFMFLFSFSAGFGGIYFMEIIAKVFNKKERGDSMALRQFFSAFGAIISGGVAGYILSNFEAPKSYAYLFIFSAILMSIGMIAFSTIQEPIKDNIRKKEESFILFLKNSFRFLRDDKLLQYQILAMLFSYSFLFAMPFVIIEAKDFIHLTGWLVGGFVSVQMIGAMFGNLLWKKLAPRYKLIFILAYVIMIISFLIVLIFHNKEAYFLFFFLVGFGMDGFKISGMNMLFEIAPEDKRPIYVALQSNLTSIGLTFSIIGGVILHFFSYLFLYIFTILFLLIGLYFVLKLKERN